MSVGWQVLRLDEVCSIARGGSPRPIKDFITQTDDGINWIKIGDSSLGGRYIESTAQKIRPEGLSKTRFVKSGSFLLSNSMSFGRPYILKIDGCIHDGWLVLEPDYKLINQDFLYHILSSAYVFDQFNNLAAGSTVRNLNIALASKVQIPVPPLEEQKRIAAILDEAFAGLDRARAHTEANLQNARDLFESYLNNMFNQKDDGWAEKRLGDIIEILTDYHANGSYKILKQHVELKKSEDYAWMVRSTDFEKDFKNLKRYIDEHAYNYLSKSKLFGGEIIMSKIGNAGKVYLMPHPDRPCSLAMNLFLIRLNDHVANNEFIFRYLNSHGGINQIKPMLNGAATQTITKDSVRSLLVPVPPLDVQNKAIKSVKKMEMKIRHLESVHKHKLADLDDLRQSLLQKAFAGELT